MLAGGPSFLESRNSPLADASGADGRIAVQEARTLLAQSTVHG